MVRRHSELKSNQKEALIVLISHKKSLSGQQYKTFKGQILKGDVEGFERGLERVLARKEQ